MSEYEHRISKLKELLGLEEDRRKLQASLASIEARIAQLQTAILGAPASPAPAPASPARPMPARLGRSPRAASAEAPRKALPAKPPKVALPAKATKPAKPAKPAKLTKAGKPVAPRGQVTDKIIAALTAAGSKGATIKEMQSTTGIGYGHLSVWFATTGKKRGDVQKMMPGKYRLRAK